MRSAATVLVLGDPGSIRDELLLRREIDVIWSASFDDALSLLRVYAVDACIVAPEFERLSGYEPFRAAIAGVPCLVRSAADEPAPRLAWPGDEVEPVLAFLARHTGLVFARYPRAPVRLPVCVEMHGEQHELETLNLSVSGVAIRGFPRVSAGTRAELCLELPDRPLYLLARVVRLLEQDGELQAGLTFTDLGEVARAALSRYVDEALPDVGGEGRLFGDLEVPLPRPRKVAGITLELEAPTGRLTPLGLEVGAMGPPAIRQITETQNLSGALVPPWFDHLSEDLSDIERLAALGGDAPEWAHRVLRLRIGLARARAHAPGEIPPTLLDEAYRTFAGLEAETADAPLQVRQQVSSIRASLLRDVLGEAI